jgi:hypothetical protein
MTGSIRFRIPILEHSKPFLVVSGNRMQQEEYTKALQSYEAKKTIRDEGRQKNNAKVNLSETADTQADEESEGDLDAAPPDGSLQNTEVIGGVSGEVEPHVVHDLTVFTTASGCPILMWSVLG